MPELEEWRPVVEAPEKYEVSTHGRVRSLPGGRRKGGILRQSTRNKDGYLCVGLYPNGGKQPKVRNVHILMLEAFVGPRPRGGVARHLNDVPSDNRLDNLAWGTYAENEADKRRNGGDLNAKGERHYHSKYTDEDIRRVHRMLEQGHSPTEIAGDTGVGRATVYDVRCGRTRRSALR
jgi:hypothetical protein